MSLHDDNRNFPPSGSELTPRGSIRTDRIQQQPGRRQTLMEDNWLTYLLRCEFHVVASNLRSLDKPLYTIKEALGEILLSLFPSKKAIGS